MYPYPLIGLDYNIENIFIDDLSIEEGMGSLIIKSTSGVDKTSFCEVIKKHEKLGDINVALLSSSSMAYYENLDTVAIGVPFEIKIDNAKIATRLDLSFIVYTKKDVKINFASIDKSLPRDLFLPKNSFLGDLGTFRYWLAHERKRSVASILRLDLNSVHYSFDLDTNKIGIRIPKDVLESYNEARDNGNLIFALYVYPVLVQAMSLVLENRSSGLHSNYESLLWFEFLQMKIDTTHINESNAILACQDLIPINIQEQVIKMIYENSVE